MPEIGTSSLMSGDWKRSYGANCDTGTGESAGNSKASQT